MSLLDAHTALIVVDVQNDFVDPEGSVSIRGATELIPPLNELVDRAVRAGATVVYTQDWHPSLTPHFRCDGGGWPRHCVQGTWGARLHPDLRVVEGPVLQKGVNGEDGYSAFFVRDPQHGNIERTELDPLLTTRGIDSVVVVGVAEDACVKATALDARLLGYRTAVVRSATRPVDADKGREARNEMARAGVAIV